MAEPPTERRHLQETDSSWLRSRGLVFAVFSILCVISAGTYVVFAVRREKSARGSGDSGRVVADTAGAASRGEC